MDSKKPVKKMTPRMEKRQKWRQERANLSRVTRARATSNNESTAENNHQEQTPSVSERGFTSKYTLSPKKMSGKISTKQTSAKHTDNKTGNNVSKNSKYGNKNKGNTKNEKKSSDDKKTEKSPNSTPKKVKVEPEDVVDKLVNSTSVHTPKRYVLFVGNLPPDISKEQIEEHFKKTGGVKAVRLPKKGSDKPKRFAYVEFNSTISHRIALRLHNTTLAGRKINVEFTSSGKGTDKRMASLKEKNDKLAKFKMPFDT